MLPSNRPQAWHRNPALSLPRQRLVAAAGRHVTPTEPRARSLAARLGDSPIFPLFPFANGERVSRVVAGSSGRRAQGAGVLFISFQLHAVLDLSGIGVKWSGRWDTAGGRNLLCHCCAA